jgi:hypothetical protein
MAKKDFSNISGDLAALAGTMPTQRLTGTRVPKPGSRSFQFSLSLSKEQRKHLMRLSAEADMTMRAFVLNALKDKGLPVDPDDLLDLRGRS